MSAGDYSNFRTDIKRRSMPPPPKFLKPIKPKTTSLPKTTNPDNGRRDLCNPYRKQSTASMTNVHANAANAATGNNMYSTNNSHLGHNHNAPSSPTHRNIFHHQHQQSARFQHGPSRSSSRKSNSQKRLDSLTGFGFEEFLNSVQKRENNNITKTSSTNHRGGVVLEKTTPIGSSMVKNMVLDGSSNSISFPTDRNARLKSLQAHSKSLVLPGDASAGRSNKKPPRKFNVLPKNLLARKYAINEKTRSTVLRSPIADRNRTSSILMENNIGRSSPVHRPNSPGSPKGLATGSLQQSPQGSPPRQHSQHPQHSQHSQQLLQWSDEYIKDTEFFTSRALWTEMKLSEASALDKGTFVPYAGNFLSAVTSHLLIAEEPLMMKWMSDPSGIQLLRTVIAHVLQGKYSESSKVQAILNQFRSYNRKSNNSSSVVPSIATPQNLETYTAPLHRKNGQNKTTYRSPTPHLMKSKKKSIQYEGERAQLIEKLIPIKTFSSRAKILREAKEREHLLLPGFADVLELLNLQRDSERRAMLATVKRYQLKQVGKIFRTWAKMSKAARRAIKFLTEWMRDSHLITARQIFNEWLHVAKNEKHHREIEFEKSARSQMDKMMNQLGRLRKKTMSHMNQLQPVMKAGDVIEAQIEPLLAILHHPARQPPILFKMISGLHRSLTVLGDTLMLQQTKNGMEEHRKGRYTARMSFVFHKLPLRSIEQNNNFDEPNKHADEPPTDDIDGAILKWRPGLLTNDEHTPAFEPFKTATGKRLKRWANHVLETEYNSKPRVEGYNTNSLKIGNSPEDDLEDGKIFAVMHRSCPQLVMHSTKRVHDALQIADAVGKLTNKPPLEKSVPTSHAKVPTVTQLLEMNAVKRSKTIINEMNKYVQPNMCRHVTSELMTGVKDPPTPEEIAAHEKRMKRLAAREKESGIIVHVMSRYMGMRIHIHDTKERVKFSLLAELLSRYQGGGICLPPELEVRTKSHLKTMSEQWLTTDTLLNDLLTKTLVAHTDAELIEFSVQLNKQHQTIDQIGSWCSECMINTLADRDEWMKWREEVTFICWQSMCTTVLSRKVKIEEDVDDGSFTTIDPLQLMGSVFKRLKIHENVPEQERALAGIVEYCKSRIRDFKRIFQYYAAAEEGNANSMDHCEYWKWVRECKLQKERKYMPSVRVDLEFQAANMDYTKTGSERLESDDGELESVEWVEVITRLSSFRYPKKPVPLDERYIKMMQEEVLENACSVDIDVFRERLAGEKVQAMLKMHKRNLKGIYTVYAADDQSDDAVAQGDTMNNKELCSFCKEMKLLGPILSNRMVRQIFAFVQQEEEDLDEDDGEDEEGGDNEMVYSEFAEATGAIACVLKPNPYCTVDSRLRDYLKQVLFPAAKKNEKTRKVVKGNY